MPNDPAHSAHRLDRLLVVGLGSIGRRHARLAREIAPDAQIIALRHEASAAAPEAGIDHCVRSVSEALAHRPQVAVISNPASLHLAVAMTLAQAGIHLLIEKPLSDRAHGVAELIEECRIRRVTLMTGYNLRFLSSLVRFRELLQGGRVGRILSVRAEVGQYLPSWRPGIDYRRTVSARAELGGGALLELSHEIDYLRWVLGEVESVAAFFGRQSRLEIDVEDMVHMLLQFAPRGGSVGTIAALSMDFVRHDTTRCCTAIGEKGSLRWDALAGTVQVFDEGTDHWSTIFAQREDADESYRAEWRHFLECIADGSEPLVSGYDGLEVLRVVEAARTSARGRAIVAVRDASTTIGEAPRSCT